MNVAVDPDRQRRGIATSLLERLFELTRDDERRGYTLEVRISNEEAIRLYERLGFEPRGIRRGYYTDNQEDALIMWRDASAARVILGIETSCDETAAAVVTDDGEIVTNVVASQAELHAQFGGVVPEVACRRHLELIAPVIDEALGGAAPRRRRRGRRHAGPGLIGALLVGVAAAKALAWARRLPLVPVNHLHGHVASLYLRPLDLEPPFTCLLASGGHTMLLDVQERGGYRVLGTTLDDAAGEAFDKGARLLGLGYPGGKEIDALAQQGDPKAYASRSRACPGSTSRSRGSRRRFSTRVRDLAPDELEARRADLAASYQRAIVRALVERIEATGAEPRSRSSAASRRTRSCARRCRTPRSRRSRSAPTTRR